MTLMNRRSASALVPFRPFSGLSEWMDELFRDLDRLWGGRLFESGLRPFPALAGTDIYEKDGQLIYETELPGVQRKDVHVRVEGDCLIISGEVKRREEVNEESTFRIGRYYGKFQRSFPLPQEAVEDPKAIQAKLEDGVLRVSVPLKESLKGPETVEIKVK